MTEIDAARAPTWPILFKEEDDVAMRTLIRRLHILAVVASTMTCVLSTGCRSGVGLGGVPGFGWLSWNKDKTPPTLLSDNDPTSHLPPPSAAADPYPPSGAVLSTASNSYGGSVTSHNSSSSADRYPSTGYPLSRQPQDSSRNYQTGPYNTGSIASRRPTDNGLGNERYLAEPYRNEYGSQDDSGSDTRNASTGRRSPSLGLNDESGPYRPFDNGRDVNQTSTLGRGGTESRYDAPARYADNGDIHRDGYYGTVQDTHDRGSRYARDVEPILPEPQAGHSRVDYRQDRSYAHGQSVDYLGSSTGHASGTGDYERSATATGQSDGDALAEQRQPATEYISENEIKRPLVANEPWRPGSTSDYARRIDSPDSSRLQPASHYHNLSTTNPPF